LCGGKLFDFVFGYSSVRISRCAGCTLTFNENLVCKSHEPAVLRQTVSENIVGARTIGRVEKDHASLIAALAETPITGPVLVLSDTDDEIVHLLGRRGIAVVRVFDVGGFGKLSSGKKFSAIVVSDAIMRVADPCAALKKLRQHLAVGSPLILCLPLLDGRQARFMGRNWHEWRAANKWFFTRETLSLLLLAAGFEHVWFRTVRRSYSLNQLVERMRGAHGGEAWLRILQIARNFSPKPFRNKEFPLPSGSAVVTAAAAPIRPESVLSIVIPVFNEKATFKTMLDALLAKELPGIRKEIIIVESQSTDGSQELVRSYAGHPDIRIIYQPQPLGKGRAVREGFLAATGDILMVQDADLEYELDDYDALLAPLLAFRSMFILGSRHQGEWKMRKFADAPILAAVLNFGHSLFRTLINIAVSTKMADPFTMFKVFRRDAIYGLTFVCNRFDFDIELVIKLVRKGYSPIELPVNYASRSFAEGKKVSVMRDGLTWVFTILRARFSPLGNGRR
jgi:hypothetical protein